MAKPRSTNRDRAKEIYLQAGGEVLLSEIAKQLNTSEGTVRGWKAKDSWENGLNGAFHSGIKNTERSIQNTERSNEMKKNATIKDSEKSNVQKPSDSHTLKTNSQNSKARFGNKNASGNKGGKGGPVRNKHAIKTHEFETVFFTADIIDEGERALLDAEYDKYAQQYILIKTLSIREKRILQDIKSVKDTPGGMVCSSVTKSKSKTEIEYKHRNKKGEEWEGDSTTTSEDGSSHVAEPVLKRVMDLEETLTRVQARKQRAIEVLHRMELDDEKLAIDIAKLELYKQRLTGQIDLEGLIDDDDLGFDI